MNNRFCFAFILLLLGILALSMPSYAEEEQKTKDTPAKVLEVNFDNIERLGLYEDKSEGALGNNLWENSKRSNITALLKAMPVHAKDSVIQNLINGILLSRSKNNFEDNEKPENGVDLLTLRIEKLIEAGAYKQAFALYSKIEESPYHERLARAGIIATIANGEKSLACLDIKTIIGRFSDEPFWQDVSAYCRASLTETKDESLLKPLKVSSRKTLLPLATDKDYLFQYTPNSFSKLSLLERALIAAEKKIDLSSFKPSKKIPAQDVQLLLLQENIGKETKLSLMGQAVEYGIKSNKDIKDYFDHVIKFPADEKPPKFLTAPSNDTEKLFSYYYTALHADNDDEKKQALVNLMNLKGNFNLHILSTFAKIISNTPIKDISERNILRVIKIVHLANEALDSDWDKIIEEKLDTLSKKENLSENEKKQGYSMATAYCLLQEKDCNLDTTRSYMKTFLPSIENKQKLFVENIIESLDGNHKNNHDPLSIYDKRIRLTFNANYVMPTIEVWKSIKEASRRDAVGETVLLSIYALGNQSLNDVYPALVVDALDSLHSVGLTHISKRLALSAVLGGIK